MLQRGENRWGSVGLHSEVFTKIGTGRASQTRCPFLVSHPLPTVPACFVSPPTREKRAHPPREIMPLQRQQAPTALEAPPTDRIAPELRHGAGIGAAVSVPLP